MQNNRCLDVCGNETSISRFVYSLAFFLFFFDSYLELLQKSTVTSHFPIFLQTWMSDNRRLFY